MTAVAGWVVALVLGCIAVAALWRAARLRGELDQARVDLGDLDDRLIRKRELEGRLSQALDAIRLGVVLSAADGSLIFRNAAATALSAGRHGNVLVAAAIDELLAAARDGETGEREVEVYGPPLHSHVVRCFPLWDPTSDEAAPIGALALVEENTERRRLDQIRRDFVANISHELRTPVGALGLLAETIQDEPEIDTVRRLAGRMVAESDRVADTIEDLLELSRIEFGDETHIDELDVDAVVGEATSRLAAAAEQRSVTLRRTGAPSCVIAGDRRQLVSAVYNLVDNAVKFSPVGGEVEVQIEEVIDGVRIAVRDHGVGIPSRDLDRIFERFYRVDRARSRETGGTGLGLAIVRHVAANHGGEVTVRSQEGVGTTFALRLPFGSVEHPVASAATDRVEVRESS
jgi:two-component system sensor histidine kinase SenX3